MSRVGNGSRRAQLSTGFCTPPACPVWATLAGTPGGTGDTPLPVGPACCGAQSPMCWGGKCTWGDLFQILGRHPRKAMLRPGAGVSWGWQELSQKCLKNGVIAAKKEPRPPARWSTGTSRLHPHPTACSPTSLPLHLYRFGSWGHRDAI